MGKKKGYNWKAREQPAGEVDYDQYKEISSKVLIGQCHDDIDIDKGSNALVFPAQKLKFKKKEVKHVGRILSRKQKKRLEKIVDQKKKKGERSNLLESLASVQVDPSLIAGLETLSSAQTKGVKRQLVEESHSIKIMQTQGKSLIEVQQDLKDSKRKKLRLHNPALKKKILPTGEDVLGFESESSDDSSGEESDEGIDSSGPSNDDDCVIIEDSNIEVSNTNEPIVDSTSQGTLDSTSQGTLDSTSQGTLDSTSQGTVESSDKETDSRAKKKGAGTFKMAVTPEEELPVEVKTSYKPVQSVKFVSVTRDPAIIESRNQLPIIGEEQKIMEMINNNQVVVLSGETGSGKTTQVPQFLYEAGYAADGKLIGITEPRRVAATAMSERVAKELGLPRSVVSYQIRFQGNVTTDTKVKFMTDGVLLREVEKDFLLTKYSVIILDEAHERSVFTDILIGLLSRIVPLRHKKKDPLKLIIMSATLRVEDFTQNSRLFKVIPPVISVESRQFPVTIHFNKHTKEDYLDEAYKKVSKIHRELPAGGILVFVTGQQEVNQLVNKLRRSFPGVSDDTVKESYKPKQQFPENCKKIKKEVKAKPKDNTNAMLESLPEINLDNYSIEAPEQLECEGELSEDEVDDDLLEEEARKEGGGQPLHVLPLYSLLPQEKQNKIFEGSPEGTRMCVVATNIAETSLTIPGIRYVVDPGKVKTKFYDKLTGVTNFVVTWTSKAAANQRAGRAGRTGPGHAYRLYSSAVFENELPKFSPPEIKEKPADGVLLQMKAMNIDKVINFPFPTSPDTIQLRTAEERLQMLGLLSQPPPGLPLREMDRLKYTSKVTPLGKVVSSLPINPRFGKILALSHQHDLLPLAIALVSVLSVQEVLVETGIGGLTVEVPGKPPKEIQQIRREWCGHGATLSLGDPMVLLSALCLSEKAEGQDIEQFCASIGLRPKALKEIRKLRRQLCNEVEAIIPQVNQLLQPGLAPPTKPEARLLQQLMVAGCGDQVARRIIEGEPGYVKGGYKVGQMEQPAFIHSTSVLKKQKPEWIVFQEIFETTDKMYMRGITKIQPELLPKYVPGLCNLGKVLEQPEPRYCKETGLVKASFNGTYGPGSFPLPLVEVEYPNSSVDKYKQFARFIMEGEVCSDLKQFRTSLLSNPIIMSKSWSNLQPKTEKLYRELAAAKVDSGKRLKRKFEEDSKFLLTSYLCWVPEVIQEDVKKIWPPNVDL